MSNGNNGDGKTRNGRGVWIPISVVLACLSTLGGSFLGVQRIVGTAPAEANQQLTEINRKLGEYLSGFSAVKDSIGGLTLEMREIRLDVKNIDRRTSRIEGQLGEKSP